MDRKNENHKEFLVEGKNAQDLEVEPFRDLPSADYANYANWANLLGRLLEDKLKRNRDSTRIDVSYNILRSKKESITVHAISSNTEMGLEFYLVAQDTKGNIVGDLTIRTETVIPSHEGEKEYIWVTNKTYKTAIKGKSYSRPLVMACNHTLQTLADTRRQYILSRIIDGNLKKYNFAKKKYEQDPSPENEAEKNEAELEHARWLSSIGQQPEEFHPSGLPINLSEIENITIERSEDGKENIKYGRQVPTGGRSEFIESKLALLNKLIEQLKGFDQYIK
jgi:hypothetical protein